MAFCGGSGRVEGGTRGARRGRKKGSFFVAEAGRRGGWRGEERVGLDKTHKHKMLKGVCGRRGEV